MRISNRIFLAVVMLACTALGVLLGSAMPVGAKPGAGGQTDLTMSQHAASIRTPLDAGFARSMLVHHHQAIELASLMLDHPELTIRHAAQGIRLKQTHENGVLMGWLLAWHEPSVTGDPMDWVQKTRRPLSAEDVLYISRCTATPGAMPGQIDASAMTRIRQAQGVEQTRLFLEAMHLHHAGAIDMARFALRHVEQPYVKSFALSVVREQAREMAWIEGQLARLSSQRTPPSTPHSPHQIAP